MSQSDLVALDSYLSVAQALLEQAADGMALIHEDGTVAYVNAAGRAWFAGPDVAAPPLTAGENYLERFAGRVGEAAAEIAAVGNGLGAILRAELAAFQRECAYGSGQQPSWLRIDISPCRIADRPGALVRHHDITEARQRERRLVDEVERLSIFDALSFDALALSENGVLIDCNDGLCRLIGYTREELIGERPEKLVVPEHREQVRAHMMTNSEEPYEHLSVRKGGEVFEAAVVGRRVMFHGRMIRGTNIRSLTTEKAAERALRRAQEEKLQAQESLLVELSTPLIPINDRVLVMPLIGSIDSQRAQQVIETLLGGIERRGARTVIIDITGVRLVDSHVASVLVQAAKATRLLGAQVVLTGIRAEVAQTLVRLGLDLGDLITKATLQSGIAYAIAQPR